MKANDQPGEMGSVVYILPISGVLIFIFASIICLFRKRKTRTNQQRANHPANAAPIDKMTSSRIEVEIQPDPISQVFTRPPTKMPAFKSEYGAISEAESG